VSCASKGWSKDTKVVNSKGEGVAGLEWKTRPRGVGWTKTGHTENPVKEEDEKSVPSKGGTRQAKRHPHQTLESGVRGGGARGSKEITRRGGLGAEEKNKQKKKNETKVADGHFADTVVGKR